MKLKIGYKNGDVIYELINGIQINEEKIYFNGQNKGYESEHEISKISIIELDGEVIYESKEEITTKDRYSELKLEPAFGIQDESAKGIKVIDPNKDKFLLKLKGMDIEEWQVMNFNKELKKWMISDKTNTEHKKTVFTLNELKELGIDIKNYDLIPVYQ